MERRIMRVLTPDATVADVAAGLANPVEYVRMMLARLNETKRPDVLVRIGVSGKGLYPCYRILCRDADGHETVLGAFNDNGTPFKTADSAESWSTSSSTLEQVAQLLGQLRAQAGKRSTR